MGSVLAGTVRLFGKVKQIKKRGNIDNNRTNADEIVGVFSKESTYEHKEFVPYVLNGKISSDINQIKAENKLDRDLPKFYEFGE